MPIEIILYQNYVKLHVLYDKWHSEIFIGLFHTCLAANNALFIKISEALEGYITFRKSYLTSITNNFSQQKLKKIKNKKQNQNKTKN